MFNDFQQEAFTITPSNLPPQPTGNVIAALGSVHQPLIRTLFREIHNICMLQHNHRQGRFQRNVNILLGKGSLSRRGVIGKKIDFSTRAHARTHARGRQICVCVAKWNLRFLSDDNEQIISLWGCLALIKWDFQSETVITVSRFMGFFLPL